MNLIANIHNRDKYDIYIGRGSIYGNPFSHQSSKFGIIKTATRAEAVARYLEWITLPEIKLVGWDKPTEDQIVKLRGKILGCFCRPVEGWLGAVICHGQILASLANTIPIHLLK